MKNLRSWPSLIVVALMVATALVPTTAAGAGDNQQLHVEQDGTGSSCTRYDPCGSIQDAVDIASPGTTILIGEGEFVANVLVETANLTVRGSSANKTSVVSGGGRAGAVGNAGNPLDAIFEVSAPGLTITRLSLVHPAGAAVKRDAAVFAHPGSDGLLVTRTHIQRLRDGRVDEPTVPGSRGVFILLSPGGEVSHNRFSGNYQDHVHLPTAGTLVEHNVMVGASRAGVSVMDPDPVPDFPSFDNVIQFNQISDSLDDGIHIQGDSNTIRHNQIRNNGGYGIYLCGADTDCYPPGANAVSEANVVGTNVISGNAQGDIADFGVGNMIG